jgi:ornithine carbamoyltransferase
MQCSTSQRSLGRQQLSGPRGRSRCVRVAARADGEVYSGKTVKPPATGKHFLHLDDFSREELQDMLDKAAFCKKKFYARDESFKPFAGQTMAMIFTKPSARTRVSFETVGPGLVSGCKIV